MEATDIEATDTHQWTIDVKCGDDTSFVELIPVLSEQFVDEIVGTFDPINRKPAAEAFGKKRRLFRAKVDVRTGELVEKSSGRAQFIYKHFPDAVKAFAASAKGIVLESRPESMRLIDDAFRRLLDEIDAKKDAWDKILLKEDEKDSNTPDLAATDPVVPVGSSIPDLAATDPVVPVGSSIPDLTVTEPTGSNDAGLQPMDMTPEWDMLLAAFTTISKYELGEGNVLRLRPTVGLHQTQNTLGHPV